MDIKKPSKKSAIETATLIGGVAGGAMASKGVFSLAHDPSQDVLVGTDWKKIAKRTGAIVAGAVVGMYVKADDALTTAIKGFGIGMAGMQAVELVADIAAKNSKAQALSTGTKAQKALAKTLGLACPEDFNGGYALNAPRRKRRGMRGAEETQFAEIMEMQPQVQGLNQYFN